MYLITGASEGIGYAAGCDLLKRSTSRVMITGRSAGKLQSARAAVPQPSRSRLLLRQCDQSNREDVNALTELIDSTESLDGAVLAVGVNPTWSSGARRTHRVSTRVVERTITTNCTHAMLLTAAVLDALHRNGGGVLVWVGSRAAAAGLPGASVYCATKSFLGGLARSVNNEYASRGIRVHVAHPGIVRTPRTARKADAFAQRHGLLVEEASTVGERLIDLVLDGLDAGIEVDL